MKRLFIATPVITLSAEIQKISADLRFQLRHDDIVWVKDDVRHLTLRFLGATPPQRVPDIKNALSEVCADNAPFTLKVNKIGVFGSHYHPPMSSSIIESGSRHQALSGREAGKSFGATPCIQRYSTRYSA